MCCRGNYPSTRHIQSRPAGRPKLCSVRPQPSHKMMLEDHVEGKQPVFVLSRSLDHFGRVEFCAGLICIRLQWSLDNFLNDNQRLQSFLVLLSSNLCAWSEEHGSTVSMHSQYPAEKGHTAPRLLLQNSQHGPKDLHWRKTGL